MGLVEVLWLLAFILFIVGYWKEIWFRHGFVYYQKSGTRACKYCGQGYFYHRFRWLRISEIIKVTEDGINRKEIKTIDENCICHRYNGSFR